MATAYFSDWRVHRRIDNKITVTLNGVYQYAMKDASGNCGYRLLFGVFNAHETALYISVNSSKWSLSEKSAIATDVIKTQAMIPPGLITVWSATIQDLPPNAHEGNFEIKIGIGNEFGKQKFELEEVASFKISAKTEQAVDASLPFSSKIIKISVK